MRDAIGREWQCGTTQVDFNLPGRFGAFYIDADSEKKTPVMIYRAMFGSLERFTGILIEHFAGHLPLWLAPLQIVVATITQEADEYALEVIAAARKEGLRVEGDLRNEKIAYKVREHSLGKFLFCWWSASERALSAPYLSGGSDRPIRRRCGSATPFNRSWSKLRRRMSGGGVEASMKIAKLCSAAQ